jgi:hypothetical protein
MGLFLCLLGWLGLPADLLYLDPQGSGQNYGLLICDSAQLRFNLCQSPPADIPIENITARGKRFLSPTFFLS